MQQQGRLTILGRLTRKSFIICTFDSLFEADTETQSGYNNPIIFIFFIGLEHSREREAAELNKCYLNVVTKTSDHENLIYSLLRLVGFAMCNSKGQQATTVNDDKALQERNKNIVRSVFNELINKRNIAAVDKFFDQKIVDHGGLEGQASGIEGFKKAVGDFIAMFSDLQITVDNMIAAGDMVATKDSWKGTRAATKKVVTGETMHVFRIVNGKITDEWSNGWEWLEGL